MIPPSSTGYAGGTAGLVGRNLPMAGKLVIGPFLAAEAARQKEGQLINVKPRDWVNETLGALETLMPMPARFGSPLGLAKLGVGAAKGLWNAPEWFSYITPPVDPAIAAWPLESGQSPVAPPTPWAGIASPLESPDRWGIQSP